MTPMSSLHTARWVLIAGLAFVFMYSGVDKFIRPLVWIGWMPAWLDGTLGMDKNLWMQIAAGAEILIGAMLVFPVYNIQRFGALPAVIHLCFILTQTGWNDIAVRDIGLLAAAVALWCMPRN